MNLRRLLLLHAIVTFVAGVVLIVAPAIIPATVGILLGPPAYLMSYLLGACEISLAALSFYGTKIRDGQALRFVCLTFIILHAVTAAVEILAYAQGLSAAIWWNVGLRIMIVGLFAHYGLKKVGH